MDSYSGCIMGNVVVVEVEIVRCKHVDYIVMSCYALHYHLDNMGQVSRSSIHGIVAVNWLSHYNRKREAYTTLLNITAILKG